jgi:hypothetical protein
MTLANVGITAGDTIESVLVHQPRAGAAEEPDVWFTDEPYCADRS